MSKKHDVCPVCGHHLEVLDRTRERYEQPMAMVVLANYCKPETCGLIGCAQKCEFYAENDEEIEKRVLEQIRKRKSSAPADS